MEPTIFATKQEFLSLMPLLLSSFLWTFLLYQFIKHIFEGHLPFKHKVLINILCYIFKKLRLDKCHPSFPHWPWIHPMGWVIYSSHVDRAVHVPLYSFWILPPLQWCPLLPTQWQHLLDWCKLLIQLFLLPWRAGPKLSTFFLELFNESAHGRS